jgi:hypothetical protein
VGGGLGPTGRQVYAGVAGPRLFWIFVGRSSRLAMPVRGLTLEPERRMLRRKAPNRLGTLHRNRDHAEMTELVMDDRPAPRAAKPKPAKAARNGGEAHAGDLVSGYKLAAHLGCSRQNIDAMAIQGIIERRPDGLFDQTACRLKVLAYLRSERRGSARSLADAEFTAAKSELIKLRIEQRKRILVPREEANACIDHTVGLFLTKLSGLAARASRDLTVRRAIDGVIFSMRQEIADECVRLADENGEPPEPEDDTA